MKEIIFNSAIKNGDFLFIFAKLLFQFVFLILVSFLFLLFIFLIILNIDLKINIVNNKRSQVFASKKLISLLFFNFSIFN